MQAKQQGFTLIELVVVIVILGILAATALPRFINLSTDAGNASAQGVAGALSSATSMNYARRLVNSAAAGTVAIGSTTACSALTPLMAGGVLSSDGEVSWVSGTDTLAGCTAAGEIDSTSCSVQHSRGDTPAAVAVVCSGS